MLFSVKGIIHLMAMIMKISHGCTQILLNRFREYLSVREFKHLLIELIGSTRVMLELMTLFSEPLLLL